MKITLRQWNQICDALDIASDVQKEAAAEAKKKGEHQAAGIMAKQADDFSQLVKFIQNSDAR